MGTIKLANGEFETEAKNRPTQERYPCLKHFWKMQDVANDKGSISGDLNIVRDSIGGNHITSSLEGPGVLFTAGDGIKMATMGSIGQITKAFSLEDKSTILMWLCTRAVGSDMMVGPARINNSNNLFDDSVNTQNKDSGNIATGTDEMAMLSIDISKTDATGIQVEKVNASGSTIVTNVKTGISSDVDLSLYTGTGFKEATAETDHYGIAMFQFTEIPSVGDRERAAIWMRERWMAGEKVIWPGWLGRD